MNTIPTLSETFSILSIAACSSTVGILFSVVFSRTDILHECDLGAKGNWHEHCLIFTYRYCLYRAQAKFIFGIEILNMLESKRIGQKLS